VTSFRRRDKRIRVKGLRHHILGHRRWAAALIALALLAKLIVPAGFMLDGSAGRITVELCTGFGVQKVEMALPGQPDQHDRQSKADSPCTFSALAAPALGGADPIQLAIAIAFVMAIGLRAVAIARPRSFAHLRPPLRGPPAIA
jgi:hypothetical protein